MQSPPNRVRPVGGDGRGRARERWEPACAENSGWTHRTQRGMTWGGREWRAGGVRPRARQRVITRSVVQRGMVLRRVSGVKLGRISRWIFSSCAPDKCQTPDWSYPRRASHVTHCVKCHCVRSPVITCEMPRFCGRGRGGRARRRRENSGSRAPPKAKFASVSRAARFALASCALIGWC